MENLSPQINQEPKPNIWEQNPKLKGLLLGLIVIFLGSGVVLVVLAQIGNNYRQKIYEETVAGLPKHESNQILLKQSVDVLGFDINLPKDWKLEYLDDQPGTIMVYPQSLYNPNYEHDYVLLIEVGGTTSSIFEKGQCDLSNSSIGGLPAIMCKEDGSLVSYYYRVTELGGTRWNAKNMISFSLPKNSLNLLDTYLKVVNSIKIQTLPLSEESLKSWKSYESKKYGYQLKYPAKYGQYAFSAQASTQDDPDFFGLTVSATAPKTSSQDFTVPEDIITFDYRKGETVKSWVDGYKNIHDFKFGDMERQEINGKEATVYGSTLTSVEPEEHLLWALWELNGGLYLYSCNVDKFPNLCNQVLNTIKFADSQDLSDWKTYKNDEYEFEFKYPSYFVEKDTNSENTLFSISTKSKRDGLVVRIDSGLDGYKFDNAPAGFICTFNSINKSWKASDAYNQEHCPQAFNQNSAVDMYLGGIADGMGAADIGYVPLREKKLFLMISLSRGYGGDVCNEPAQCPDDYPKTNQDTLKAMLKTFKLTK